VASPPGGLLGAPNHPRRLVTIRGAPRNCNHRVQRAREGAGRAASCHTVSLMEHGVLGPAFLFTGIVAEPRLSPQVGTN